MTTLFWDCFSGIAGNMAVASLLDLGADSEKLRAGLASIPFEEGAIELIVEERVVDGIRGIYFNTLDDESYCHNHDHQHSHDHRHDHDHSRQSHEGHDHEHLHHHHAPHRGLKEINGLIASSALSERAKDMACRIFAALADAEAHVHCRTVDEVHFHEVGARDSIADILGVAICLDDLDIEKIVVSPVRLGSGFVKCAHGKMPVPAPATAILLCGLPVVFDYHLQAELTTPTGAAILKGLGAEEAYGNSINFSRVGHGHGSMKLPQANFLRAFLIENEQVKKNSDCISVLETNLDNVSGELLGYATETLMQEGALDVCLIPVLMKKGRPGHILQVQTLPDRHEKIEKLIFKLLPTLGIRKKLIERTVLERRAVQIETTYGMLKGKKITRVDGSMIEVPEFDEIIKVSRQTGKSPEEIISSLKCRF